MFKIAILISIVSLVSACGQATSEIVEVSEPTPTKTVPVEGESNIADQNFRIAWEKSRDDSLRSIESHLQKWKQQNITNYDFVIWKIGPGHTNTWDRAPVLIEVRNGSRQSLVLANAEDKRLVMARLDGFDEIDSIDKLFEYLKSEVENGRIVAIDYDKRLGYPELSTISFTFAHLHGWRNIKVTRLERR